MLWPVMLWPFRPPPIVLRRDRPKGGEKPDGLVGCVMTGRGGVRGCSSVIAAGPFDEAATEWLLRATGQKTGRDRAYRSFGVPRGVDHDIGAQALA